MIRLAFKSLFSLTVRWRLGTPAPQTMASDGRAAPPVYKIGRNGHRQYCSSHAGFRKRAARCFGLSAQVQLNAQLNAAQQPHARDMPCKTARGNFGSDGVVARRSYSRVAYTVRWSPKSISGDLRDEPGNPRPPDGTTRYPPKSSMSKDGFEHGLFCTKEENGKIWWTMVMGK